MRVRAEEENEEGTGRSATVEWYLLPHLMVGWYRERWKGLYFVRHVGGDGMGIFIYGREVLGA